MFNVIVDRRIERKEKKYFITGSRWRVKKLSYKISKYPRNLPQHKVDAELNKAFKVWSEYTDLVFVQKKSGQVRRIMFAEIFHNREVKKK